MRIRILAALLGTLCLPSQAFEIFDGYTLSKDVINVSYIRVKPNKVDEYLEGISQSWVASCELQKKIGTVKACQVLLANNLSHRGFNLILGTRTASAALSDPDEKMYKEFNVQWRKILEEGKQKKLVEGYELIREFYDESNYREITFK